MAHYLREDSVELPIHPLSRVDIEIKSADEIKQQLDPCAPPLTLCVCMSVCVLVFVLLHFTLKLRQPPCYPWSCRKKLSLQGICHKCTSDFVIHSNTNRLHTRPKTCPRLFVIHSKPESLTHTHAEAITANTLPLAKCAQCMNYPSDFPSCSELNYSVSSRFFFFFKL